MQLPVIVNKNGGTAAKLGETLEATLADAFRAAGADADIQPLDGGEMTDAIDAASKQGRVVVAGGDGTAACAAQQLVDGDAELGLLPLGTLNHLARDLGLPSDLNEAAKIAATGKATAIDVAEVDGHVFVNNASIGLYPLMVKTREGLQDDKGWPKWLSTVPAAFAAIKRLPQHRLRLDLGQGEQTVVTPLLFVGNNVYSLDRGEIGERKSLTGGRLSVYAVAHRSRSALLWFAARTLVGRAQRSVDFVAIGECETLTVRTVGSIDIALDGEVQRLASPLEFRIRPGALKVVTG
ncbi:diacylglycerol/lipid kinase family protein [Sphingomonas sp.]|uniref:diacylglycerol/lipid kinase family protein n=1 Tax=Sphingomonas sp. TaxID=28214 RepID=UPI002E2FA010|nr:diacylglycerol kinase family protein [Sphingomonas sp.]HEX4695551.1 diacylglycerol kinase family protein [Sphingomonas sp.]